MKLTMRSLGLIGLLGGVGGAINAWLCYANLPVAFGDGKGPAGFSWHIIPLGCAHGALLALTAVGLALLFSKGNLLVRCAGLPISGWLSGWFSLIPIHLYLAVKEFGVSPRRLFAALIWPLNGSHEAAPPWMPFLYFGFVGLAYYFLLNICRQLPAKKLLVHVVMGSASGSLGSLWWWSMWKPWYFSALHGTIWGSLVGFGVWKSQRAIPAD